MVFKDCFIMAKIKVLTVALQVIVTLSTNNIISMEFITNIRAKAIKTLELEASMLLIKCQQVIMKVIFLQEVLQQ